MTIANLTRVGDALQSAASRVGEHLHAQTQEDLYLQLPYEVQMAVLEIERSVADWTAIRRTMTSSSTDPSQPGAGGVERPEDRHQGLSDPMG